MNFILKFFKRNIYYSYINEQCFLGSLIINFLTWEKISDCINKEYFYFYNHKLIFSLIKEYIDNNNFININVLNKRFFKNNKKLLNYLNVLIQKTPNPNNIENYFKIIKEMYLSRRIIYNYWNIFYNFSINSYKISDLLLKIENELIIINDINLNKNFNLNIIHPIFNNVIKEINNIKISGKFNGIRTGFNELDNILTGLHKGEFIIIAGRPSMGKTTFAINIAQNIAINENLPVLIFSMEMSSYQLGLRILSNISGINQIDMKNGYINDNQIEILKNISENFKNLKIFIDENINLTTLDIFNKSKKIIKKYGNLGLIVVDYLQLMNSSNLNQNRVMEISEISRSLKCLSKELSAPIIAISQLNRSLENRGNKKPIMSDLRESGAIEQDADIILFIYREEVYNIISKNKGIAEIIIAKQRNGPIGSINLNFSGEKLKFENIII